MVNGSAFVGKVLGRIVEPLDHYVCRLDEGSCSVALFELKLAYGIGG